VSGKGRGGRTDATYKKGDTILQEKVKTEGHQKRNFSRAGGNVLGVKGRINKRKRRNHNLLGNQRKTLHHRVHGRKAHRYAFIQEAAVLSLGGEKKAESTGLGKERSGKQVKISSSTQEGHD